MMKKLMLSKGKAMTCLILMCLFIAQSCRKENFKLTEQKPDGQLIKQETINKWLETNPVAKYISLDWSKAKQAIIQGKNVVRVPTLNINKINALNKNAMLKENLLASNGAVTNTSNTGNTSNYYTQHPPEVFFIQNNGNEKLHSYLLNFVPEDKTKEFGENGLWTGKLYEWNLTGDTLAVQELIKSVVKHKYLLKFGTSDSDKNINSILKSNKLQSIGGLKDKQFSSFFGWLANLLENVIGWVGSLFGFSDYVGGYNEWGYWEGWRIMPWSDGGGSGGGGSTYGGEIVYGSYLSGYGGMPGGGNYEPYNYNGGLNSSPDVVMADYIISTFSIQNLDQQTFLYNHPAIANTIFAYAEQLGTINPKDIEFVQWAIEALSAKTYSTLEELLNRSPYKPNIRIPLETRMQYPAIAKIIDGLYLKVKNDASLMSALKEYSNLTENQILANLKDGNGPIVGVKALYFASGQYDKNLNVIYIAKEVAEDNNYLRLGQSSAFEFYMAAIILHEYIHFGNNLSKIYFPKDQYGNDAGFQFEGKYYGGKVQFDTLHPNIIWFKKLSDPD